MLSDHGWSLFGSTALRYVLQGSVHDVMFSHNRMRGVSCILNNKKIA